MTPLSQQLADYLAVRRSLGFDMTFEERVLRLFTAFADREAVDHITVDLFLRWKAAFGTANKTRGHIGWAWCAALPDGSRGMTNEPRSAARTYPCQVATATALHLLRQTGCGSGCTRRQAAVALWPARLDLLDPIRAHRRHRVAHQRSLEARRRRCRSRRRRDHGEAWQERQGPLRADRAKHCQPSCGLPRRMHSTSRGQNGGVLRQRRRPAADRLQRTLQLCDRLPGHGTARGTALLQARAWTAHPRSASHVRRPHHHGLVPQGARPGSRDAQAQHLSRPCEARHTYWYIEAVPELLQLASKRAERSLAKNAPRKGGAR